MFNQCTPSFASGFAGFNPFGFGGGQPFAQPFGQNFAQNFGFSGFAPFNGFNPNGFTAAQNWQGQNWQGQNWNNQPWNGQNWNNSFNGTSGQNFDWNAFCVGCYCGYQNACSSFANQGENTQPGAQPAANTTGFNGFGFFPYGPFPFNFNTQNACPPNQQAA